MKTFKFRLKLINPTESDDFIISVRRIVAKSQKSALKDLQAYSNIDRFIVLSCEVV